ncbi:unnamed protein product [Calypogeia fissa]
MEEGIVKIEYPQESPLSNMVTQNDRLGEPAEKRLEKPSKFRYADVDVPLSVDWREKSIVTPIKDQGSCGSCWAFCAIGSVKGINAMKIGRLISLFEQELVDCDTSYNAWCNFGLMTHSSSS